MHFYEQENSKVTFVYFAFTLRPYQRGPPHSLRTTAACNNATCHKAYIISECSRQHVFLLSNG